MPRCSGSKGNTNAYEYDLLTDKLLALEAIANMSYFLRPR